MVGRILSVVHLGTKLCNGIRKPTAACDSFAALGLMSSKLSARSSSSFSPAIMKDIED